MQKKKLKVLVTRYSTYLPFFLSLLSTPPSYLAKSDHLSLSTLPPTFPLMQSHPPLRSPSPPAGDGGSQESDFMPPQGCKGISKRLHLDLQSTITIMYVMVHTYTKIINVYVLVNLCHGLRALALAKKK